MTVRSSISLTDEENAFARRLVEQGRYPNVSAVLQQGLALLRRKTEADALEAGALRALVKKRRAGVRSGAHSKTHITAMAARKRRAS